MCTMTNNEDPDEIPHDAAFHQGLHYLFRERNTIITCDPSIYAMDHGKFIVGISHIVNP